MVFAKPTTHPEARRRNVSEWAMDRHGSNLQRLLGRGFDLNRATTGFAKVLAFANFTSTQIHGGLETGNVVREWILDIPLNVHVGVHDCLQRPDLTIPSRAADHPGQTLLA
eukprot:8392243-Pyramimonas_sp.AAC.1